MQVNENGGVTLSKEREDILKLWIEGVYISAAYVAAGLVAAYQCPEYLKTCFRNVTPKYPGVRFDIESDDYSLRVTTTMAKEIKKVIPELAPSIIHPKNAMGENSDGKIMFTVDQDGKMESYDKYWTRYEQSVMDSLGK